MLANHVEAVEGLVSGDHVAGVADLEECEVARRLEGAGVASAARGPRGVRCRAEGLGAAPVQLGRPREVSLRMERTYILDCLVNNKKINYKKWKK